MANYYSRFLQVANKWPAQVAVEMHRQGEHGSAEIERYTYSELRRMSESVGRWLSDTGLSRGTRCGILAGNSPRWAAVFLGTMAAGHIAVPIDIANNAEQIHKLLENSGASMLFVDARHLGTAEHAIQGLEVRLVHMEKDPARSQAADLDDILGSGPGDFSTVETESSETAAILYSSGTTGDPKGVMLTHANITAETESIFKVFTIGPEDSMLGILPLFHALALAINLLLPLAAGTRIVFLESVNTTELMRALPSVNIFICVPQFFYLIHERIWKEIGARGALATKVFKLLLKVSLFGRKFGLNLGKVFFAKVHHLLGPNRYLGTGGSRFDGEIGREFEALGFHMLQGYGLTETTGCACYTPPDAVDIGSVGLPLPGMDVRLLNPRPREGDVGRPVGEVLIRGPIVMKGYWNRPDATAAAIDSEGWLHTGDLGYVDTNGNLFITGREKEVIVLSSGKNVYPEEIEAHYLKTPFIKEICVLGLETDPDEPLSERLHGVVVPNFDLLRERKIVNTREVIRYEIENLSAQLPATKRILSYEIWQEDLPRTTTRKLKRFEIERRVRERVAQGEIEGPERTPSRQMSESDREWMDQPDVRRAMAIIRQATKGKKEEIHPADNLELDLGLDSMERVELLVALDRELGGNVEDSVASQVYTVREMIETVRQNAGSGGPKMAAPAWDTILQEDPADPAVLDVVRPHTISTVFWFLMTRFGNMIAHYMFSLRVQGLEKLPSKGPYIICPNHQSFLDPPVMMSTLPWFAFKELFYVGTSEIFGEGVWRMVARSLKLVPVDPDSNLIPAMRAGAYGLRHGKVLVLYPEGERSIDGIPKTFKKGAAILSVHLNVPIVPVAMDGFYEAWPRGRKFQKFTRTRIVIGDPILPPAAGPNPEQTYAALTAELRSKVMSMWEPIHDKLYGEEEAPVNQR
jgi:long-chain acyl-CoA synthetase